MEWLTKLRKNLKLLLYARILLLLRSASKSDSEINSLSLSLSLYIYIYIYIYRERERETTPAEMKASYGQLTRTGHSQTQILELKKNNNPIKTVSTIKTKGNIKINHLLPENDLKRQKNVLKKKWPKSKLTCWSFKTREPSRNFELRPLLNLLGSPDWFR